MNPHLEFLLSSTYTGALAPTHLAELVRTASAMRPSPRSGFVPARPHLIDRILGYKTPHVASAYLLPFPDSAADGWTTRDCGCSRARPTRNPFRICNHAVRARGSTSR